MNIGPLHMFTRASDGGVVLACWHRKALWRWAIGVHPDRSERWFGLRWNRGYQSHYGVAVAGRELILSTQNYPWMQHERLE
jgi:hypothetical protein